VETSDQSVQSGQPNYNIPPSSPINYQQSPPPQSQQPPAQYQQPPPVYYQQPVSPQIPAQPPIETIVGAIPLRKMKSLGRSDSWTAIITGSRIVFAQITSQMVKDSLQQARDQAKAQGKGMLGQWSEQMKGAYSGYTQRFLTMTPNAALAETPGNIAVDNMTIREIKFHTQENYRGGELYNSEFKVEFKSSQGNYEFQMSDDAQAVELFKQVYGDRVKMPFGYHSFGHGIHFKIGP